MLQLVEKVLLVLVLDTLICVPFSYATVTRSPKMDIYVYIVECFDGIPTIIF